MSRKIVLFIIATEPEAKEAEDLIRNELADFECEVVRCPPSMDEIFPTPFIRHGRRPYFGMGAIRNFVRLHSARNALHA
jgi:hypothetical protein